VSAMRNKFPHPRSEKRQHVWDVVKNVKGTRRRRSKSPKRKEISLTVTPSLDYIRSNKNRQELDVSSTPESPPKLPPKSPPKRRRGSILRLKLKSHVKSALSRSSIVSSPHANIRENGDVTRRASIAYLDKRGYVKKALIPNKPQLFRSDSLDDLHRRGHVSNALSRDGEFLKTSSRKDDDNRRGSVESLHGKAHVRNALVDSNYLNKNRTLTKQNSFDNLHGRGHVKKIVSRQSIQSMETSPSMLVRKRYSPKPIDESESQRAQLTRNFTTELRNAIQSKDMMLTRLVLSRVRSDCSEEEQNEGELYDAIQDAEMQLRTFKTNESHCAALDVLSSSLERCDMKTLRMALRDVSTASLNEEETELVRKAVSALEIYDSKRRVSFYTLELHEAIRIQDMDAVKLVLTHIRDECTKKQQNEGALSRAIQDAEMQLRTYKTNEKTRTITARLREAVQSQDMAMLNLELSRARKECMLLSPFFFLSFFLWTYTHIYIYIHTRSSRFARLTQHTHTHTRRYKRRTNTRTSC